MNTDKKYSCLANDNVKIIPNVEDFNIIIIKATKQIIGIKKSSIFIISVHCPTRLLKYNRKSLHSTVLKNIPDLHSA